MRLVRKLVAVGTALGASLCLVAAQPGVVSAAGSTTEEKDPCSFTSDWKVEVCFNDPTSTEHSDDIFDSLGALIDEVNSGDSLRIMMFAWDDRPSLDGDNPDDHEDTPPERLAQKVVDARQRNAAVDVILDERSEDPDRDDQPIDILKSGGVPITICRDNENRVENCLMFDDPDYYEDPTSPLPMNHTKMVLATIDGKHYVAAGSSNLTTYDHQQPNAGGERRGAWNDFVRIYGDEALYNFLNDWYGKVKKDDWGYWDTNQNRDSSGDSDWDDMPTRAWVYPRVGDGDPVVGQLANVTACSDDGDRDGDWDKRVWMAMSDWNEEQRTKVLGQLDRLQEAGCDVQVLLAQGPNKEKEPKKWKEWQQWKQTLRERISGDPYNWDEVRVKCGLHHKFFVLDAKYQGDWHEVVITGSEILAEGSRGYSTELNVRIGGDHQYKPQVRDYITHMQGLWDKAPHDSCG